MRRLLLCALLTTLPACCGTLSAAKPTPCAVPVAPVPPDIHPFQCGESVCLSIADTVALGRYLTLVAEVESALHGCHLVQRVTP